MRTTAALGLMVAIALAGACGDTVAPKDAGTSAAASGKGGAGGVGPSDGGGRGGTGGGVTGAGAGGGAPPVGGTSGSVFQPQTCQQAVDVFEGHAFPDAGDDACLSCLLSRCCDNERTAVCLTDVGNVRQQSCYRDNLGPIRECFGRALEAEADAGSLDAGWEGERWDVLAGCAPRTEVNYLLECAVGSWPLEFVRDQFAGSSVVLEDGGSMQPDAGSPYHPRYPEARCADECFPGWR